MEKRKYGLYAFAGALILMLVLILLNA